MKLNITYLLLLLVISPNLYGAESESSALAEQQPNFQPARVPSKWVKKGNDWQPCKRKLATFIILGSDEKDPRNTCISDTEKRPRHAYDFVQSALYGAAQLYTPVQGGAEKIVLDQDGSTKIVQFGREIRSAGIIGSHETSPRPTGLNIFNKQSKKGRLSQNLIILQEDSSPNEGDFLVCPKACTPSIAGVADVIDKDISKLAERRTIDAKVKERAKQRAIAVLSHGLQKSNTALAIREKQILEKKVAAETLIKEIEAFSPTISKDFAFYMGALIDVHQSENRYHIAENMYVQPEKPDSDEQTIDFIFNAANDEFILNRRELTTKTEKNTDVIFDFSAFVKKDGKLPVEECGLQARKIHKNMSWYNAFLSEPTEATELRKKHADLMAKREELAKEELVDRHPFIQNQIELLQELRDDAFVKLRTQLFEAAKMLTSKDLVTYCYAVQNRERLANAESYLSDEKEAIAREKERIAKETAILHAKPAADDKGKEEA